MKKHKKLLSVLLSVLMVLSVISAGLVAAAQEPDGAVTALEEKITAFNGNMSTNAPSAEDKAAYDELVAGFKALTDEQKNSIDIVALDKLTQLMYVYECAVASDNASSVSSSVRREVSAKIVSELNAPDINAAQAAVDAGLVKTSTNAETLLQLFKDLSVNARVIAGTAYSTYGLFYYGMNADNNYQAGAFYNVVNRVWTDLKKADPYEGERPSSGDYPETSKDPQYVADMRAYNLAKEAHEYGKLPEAINKVVTETGASEYAQIATFVPMATEAVKAFQTNKDYQKAAEASEYYNNFSAIAKSALRGLRAYACSYMDPDPLTETWTSTEKVYARDLPGLVSDYAKYAEVGAFETYIAAVNEPYTLEVALEAREKYDALPSSLRSELSDEAKAKIDALTYFALTNNASQERPEFPAFNKTAVTYPAGAPYSKVQDSLPKMNSLVNEIAKLAAGSDLQTLVSSLYTNASVTSVAQAIGPLLTSLGMGEIKPSHLLNHLATQDEEGNYTPIYPEWKGAVQALINAVEAGDTWEVLTYNDGDWFLDGDKEGFSRAVSMHLTLLMDLKYSIINVGSMLFSSLQFENEYDFENNTYSQGSYENIVHIFEAIGIDCMDSATYSEAVDAAETDDEKIVARFVPILNAVFDFLDEFAETPVTTLMEVLPNLAYALNSGVINDNVKAIIGRVEGLLGLAGVTLPTLDFTAEGLFDTLGGLGIEGITYDPGSVSSGGTVNYPNTGTLTINIAVNETTTIPFSISEAEFIQFLKDVEGCGAQVVTDSVCLDSAYRVAIEADQPDVFVTLVRFVYDDVLMANSEAAKSLVSALNPTLGSLLGPVFDVIKQFLPADAAIVALVTIADPLPEIGGGGSGGGLEDLGNFFEKIRDFFNNLFGGGIGDIPIVGDIVNGIGGLLGGGGENNPGGGSGEGTEQTGDPNIPTTGSTIAGIASSAIALAVGAAVTLLAVKSRRDRED